MNLSYFAPHPSGHKNDTELWAIVSATPSSTFGLPSLHYLTPSLTHFGHLRSFLLEVYEVPETILQDSILLLVSALPLTHSSHVSNLQAKFWHCIGFRARRPHLTQVIQDLSSRCAYSICSKFSFSSRSAGSMVGMFS